MLTRKVQGKGFLYSNEADIWEVLDCRVAVLTEEDLEVMIAFTETEVSCTGVEGPHLTTNALKKHLQMADHLVKFSCEAYHFMGR